MILGVSAKKSPFPRVDPPPSSIQRYDIFTKVVDSCLIIVTQKKNVFTKKIQCNSLASGSNIPAPRTYYYSYFHWAYLTFTSETAREGGGFALRYDCLSTPVTPFVMSPPRDGVPVSYIVTIVVSFVFGLGVVVAACVFIASRCHAERKSPDQDCELGTTMSSIM